MVKKKDISMRKSFNWKFVFLSAFLFFVLSLGVVSSQVITSSRLIDSDGNVQSKGILFDYKNTTSYTDGTKLTENMYLSFCGHKNELENKYVATFYRVGELFLETSIIPLKIHGDDFGGSSSACIRKDIDFNPMVAVYPGLQFFSFYDTPNFPKYGEETLDMYAILQNYGFFNGSFEFELKNFTVNGENFVELNITDVLDHEGNSINTTYIDNFDAEILIGLRYEIGYYSYNTTKKGQPVNLTLGPNNINDFEIIINGFVNGVPAIIVEPPEPPVPPAPAPGPGGVRIIEIPPAITSYEVFPEEIELKILQKELRRVRLLIENTGETEVNFSFSSDLDFVGVPSDFSLDVNDSREIEFTIYGPAEPGIYTGRILIDGSGLRTRIPVILEVQRGVLFDLFVEVLPEYKIVHPGEFVKAKIELINLGDVIAEDVVVEFYISDAEEKLVSRSKTLDIEGRIELFEEFYLPEDFEEGEYRFNTILTHGGVTLISYDNFHVRKRPDYLLIILTLGVLTLLSAFYIILSKSRLKDKYYLNRLNTLAQETHSLLSRGNFDEARNKYRRIRGIYNSKLQDEFKRKFYDKGIGIYGALKSKGVDITHLHDEE